MVADTSENKVQKNVIRLLEGMGFTYISRSVNNSLRNNRFKDVLLKDILKEQLESINSFSYKRKTYKFSEKNIDQAIVDLDIPMVEGLQITNEKIYDMLTLGKAYEERLEDRSKKSFSFKYIDFDNPENNVYHFTEEFDVEMQIPKGKEENRRPDIVIFINGIPVGVIELKKSSIGIKEGISQQIRNQRNDEIPHLFKYVQIVAAGNPHSAKYATAGTPEKFWAVWKEEKDISEALNLLISDRLPNELDRTIYSLFRKERLLELIESYTIFDNNIKKVARYQQFFSIRKTLERIESFDSLGIRRGGLIWHTQGSGKSLTMVMLAKAVMKRVRSSQIVIVTDRKSLDRQIHGTFLKTGIGVSRATDGNHLVEMLKSNRSQVITTIINKFNKAVSANIVIDCPNTFVLVDESHRSQYQTLHSNMKKVFPKACYIGFTGTPLMKKDRNSFSKFGGMIHKYTIDEAVEDKAVLPLLYEGRFVDQWINDPAGLDKKFDLISKNLTDSQKEDLSKKWAIFQKVASSERRLEAIALDINNHFITTWKGTGFKGMLATNSKYEAIKYQQIFERYGDVKTAVIISSNDSRNGFSSIDEENKQLVQQEISKMISQHGDLDKYEETIKDEFIYGDELELLIVVDKLLTGFDAPRASVLYIDKQLKEHKLLQAIARVNRLSSGKDYGYIVDYRGLLGNLDQALTSYSSLDGFDEDDIAHAVIDIKSIISEIKSYYSNLQSFFRDVKNKEDMEEYEISLEDKEMREEFFDILKHFSKRLKIALSSDKLYDILTSEEISKYKRALKFYNELRKSVRIRYQDTIDFGEYENEMQKLLDTYISADSEVNQLTTIVNLFDVENFDREVTRVEGKRAKADTIRSAMDKVISLKLDENPVFYEQISKKIGDVIEMYRSKRITEDEYLAAMKDLMTSIRDEGDTTSNYPEAIKEKKNAQVLYDNIHEYFQKNIVPEVNEDMNEWLVKGAVAFDEKLSEIRNKPDWKTNIDVHKEISRDFCDILWDIEDAHNDKSEDSISIDTDEVIEDILLKIALKRY